MWAQDCRFCEGFADVAVLVLGFEGAGNEGKHKVNTTVFQICTQFRGIQQVDVHALTLNPTPPAHSSPAPSPIRQPGGYQLLGL